MLLATRFAADSAGGIAALGVDVKALILQILTFVIVFLLLKKYALGKIIAALEKRQQTINQGVELGQEMQEEKEKLAQQVAKALQAARIEADKIIADAHKSASTILQDADLAATRKTAAMLKDAEGRIEENMKRAKRELEHEVASLVADAAAALLEEKLDAKKDASLIERALKKVGTW